VPGVIAGMNTHSEEIKKCEYKTFADFVKSFKFQQFQDKQEMVNFTNRCDDFEDELKQLFKIKIELEKNTTSSLTTFKLEIGNQMLDQVRQSSLVVD
jgi:hypothetical protein